MDHFNRIAHALTFIETHLVDDFSLDDVSRAAFSSLSYMHRIFYQLTGLTMKDYIRQRRLATAVRLLQTTHQSILTIALQSGYQSAESFSRAFKKQFSLSPDYYRKQLPELALCQPFDLDNRYQFINPDQLDFNLTLTAVTLAETTILGFQTSTSMDNNQHIADICAFANHYLDKGLLANHFDCHKTNFYGVYTDMTSQNDFNYTIGGLADACLQKSQDLVAITLPASTYAKFTLDRNDRIKEAWHYIYGIWFPKIESLRTTGFDFEIYFNDQTNIYIPMTHVPLSL